MSKHTPGPWIAKPGVGDEAFVIEVDVPNGLDLAHILPADPMIADVDEPEDVDYEIGLATEANAHLVAAAPELLEALKELVKVNEEWNAAVEAVIGRPAGWNADYLDQAKAAIAKAEGAQ